MWRAGIEDLTPKWDKLRLSKIENEDIDIRNDNLEISSSREHISLI